MQEARKQSLRVSQDPSEKEILDWIEAASDTEGWTWEDGGSQLLETAIKIAVDAHKGQVDKAGKPYILHPLRVMLAVDTDSEKIVAVLHDVVEDTDWTFGRLRDVGFPEDVLDAIYSVTRLPGESFMEFIRRAGQNEVGRKVKIADLQDNLDLSRIAEPTDKDRKRMKKYRKALEILECESK